jgi:fatty acid desaturase
MTPKLDVPRELSYYSREANASNFNLVSPDIIREMSKLNPLRSCSQIALEWLFILGAIVVCHNYWNIILYIITIMWIGGRMHALGILMHDAVHYRIANRRRLNDVLGEVFLAWPLFVTLQAFRRVHLAHHRGLNTSEDPEWVRKQTPEWRFPKSKFVFILSLVADLLAISVPNRIIQLKRYKNKSRNRALFAVRMLYYIVIAFLIMYYGLGLIFVLYWIIPFTTWLNMVSRIRSISEHSVLGEADEDISHTRTTYLSIFEQIFMTPHNINYHIEHHLYPSVPYYRLPELHSILMKNPHYSSKAHITVTYAGLFRECISGYNQRNVSR